MHIQNHFPVIMRTEQVIQKRVEKVRDEEKNKRQDLHVLASSYLGILKQKCSQLIQESEFHQVSEKVLEQEKAMNGDASKLGELSKEFVWLQNKLTNIFQLDKKPPKDRERSEKKVIKLTAEREIKKNTPTPVREPSRDQREPTPREKPVKEVKAKEDKRETKEREESDQVRKRDKDNKERRREKRQTSPAAADTFEGDLSSVSNSSNGSIHPSGDVVIVEDQRGENLLLLKKNRKFIQLILLQNRNAAKSKYQRRRLVLPCEEKKARPRGDSVMGKCRKRVEIFDDEGGPLNFLLYNHPSVQTRLDGKSEIVHIHRNK